MPSQYITIGHNIAYISVVVKAVVKWDLIWLCYPRQKKFLSKTSLAENGIEVIKLVSENEYDVIFIDMLMPLMDGVELTETILKNHLDLKAPIIAITANAMNTDKSIYLQAVMKGFISKTVQLKKIGSTLDYYFK